MIILFSFTHKGHTLYTELWWNALIEHMHLYSGKQQYEQGLNNRNFSVKKCCFQFCHNFCRQKKNKQTQILCLSIILFYKCQNIRHIYSTAIPEWFTIFFWFAWLVYPSQIQYQWEHYIIMLNLPRKALKHVDSYTLENYPIKFLTFIDSKWLSLGLSQLCPLSNVN